MTAAASAERRASEGPAGAGQDFSSAWDEDEPHET